MSDNYLNYNFESHQFILGCLEAEITCRNKKEFNKFVSDIKKQNEMTISEKIGNYVTFCLNKKIRLPIHVTSFLNQNMYNTTFEFPDYDNDSDEDEDTLLDELSNEMNDIDETGENEFVKLIDNTDIENNENIQ